MAIHEHRVRIYYEDTDHSGLVYHANYLKYCERAREHLLGTQELRRLLLEDGIGFVVYKAELTYKKGAVFGDEVVVRTHVVKESAYRAIFHQDTYRGDELLVAGTIQLVCIDQNEKLVPLPESAVRALAGFAS